MTSVMEFKENYDGYAASPSIATAVLPPSLQPRRKILNVAGEIIDQSPRESLVAYQEPQAVASLKTKEDTDTFSEAKPAIVDTRNSQALSDILNAILPPRTFTIRGEKVIQNVSTEPSSREHVIQLQHTLDARLLQRQARDAGICAVREELYSQCFDELLRQITIDSPERGLMLLRVRDEARMTIAAYQTLYSSSMTWGQRKSMASEAGLAELTSRLEQLEQERARMNAAVNESKMMYETLEKTIIEQKVLDEKKMNEEKEYLKFQAAHLEAFLKSAT